MEGSAIVGSMTRQRVASGGSETINDPARDEYGTTRLPHRRDSIRAKLGVQCQEDADRSRQWARACMFIVASAIRTAADLRFEICDELPTLGCVLPIVWAETRAYAYMGDDPDIEGHYPWWRFGGFSWDESVSHDEALGRFKEAVNLLHMGDLPDEMAGKPPESFLYGIVGSVEKPCPVVTSVFCPSMVDGHGLWP